MFGGLSVTGESNDLWAFNIETYSWRKLIEGGIDGRYSSSATINNDNLYIFGGVSLKRISEEEMEQKIFGELLILDLSVLNTPDKRDAKWEVYDLAYLGVKRYRSILFFFEGKMYIYGGDSC